MKLRLRVLLSVVAVAVSGCEGAALDLETGQLRQAGVGVPVDGYPNHDERLMLVAINRARAEPNSVALGTSGACGGNGSSPFAVSDPLVLNIAGSKAARFHCRNCLLNAGGLSHSSYCTLKADIGTSGCDGSLACACKPGSEHFNCTTGGGRGSDPWTRTARFGFSANGEVGAVSSGGQLDAFDAVAGWVTECPSYEGHRRILLDADDPHTQIGLGAATGSGACWDRFYFGDTSSAATASPRLPAGAHRPIASSAPAFFLNLFDPGGQPDSVQVVVDGRCHPLALEAGSPGHGTYRGQVSLGGGCHEYWFLVRDSQGARFSYPETGSYGCGSCSDYRSDALAADCESGPDGGSDAGPDGEQDGGPGGDPNLGRIEGGCGCGQTPRPASLAWLLFGWLVACLALRCRRGRSRPAA